MSRAYEYGLGVPTPEVSVDDLAVQGLMPEWLTGTLVRNGPGTLQVGEQRYRHWFDGLAMLHKFSFAGGRVAYANKFLDTKAYRAAQETGQIAYAEFATDPCRSMFARVMAVFDPQTSDNAKVNLAKHADHYLALAETPLQVEFDLETLRTAGVFSYEDNPVGQMTTVHPHFDGGDMYNLVTRYHRVSHYRVYRVGPDGARARVSDVPAKQPAYMHSFGMSARYVILTEFPLVVNPLALLLWLRPFIENFQWKPERGTPFWVLDRQTGEVVARFDSDPFFAFHHVNAFEDGDDLVVDIVAYPDADVISAFYLKRLEDAAAEIPFGNLRRYRLPLKSAGTAKRARRREHVSYETISEACLELPRFDYARYNMRSDYRYVYASSIHPQNRQGFYNQIAKVDIGTRTTQTWFEDGCYPGEPVFVGAPGRTAEDDGVVLSVVLDATRGHSFLLVLDAASLGEIARAYVPHPILFGYHGEYFQGQ
jgi:beta,beta-carotene 9',10'-dioxygenase